MAMMVLMIVNVSMRANDGHRSSFTLRRDDVQQSTAPRDKCINDGYIDAESRSMMVDDGDVGCVRVNLMVAVVKQDKIMVNNYIQ